MDQQLILFSPCVLHTFTSMVGGRWGAGRWVAGRACHNGISTDKSGVCTSPLASPGLLVLWMRSAYSDLALVIFMTFVVLFTKLFEEQTSFVNHFFSHSPENAHCWFGDQVHRNLKSSAPCSNLFLFLCLRTDGAAYMQVMWPRKSFA